MTDPAPSKKTKRVRTSADGLQPDVEPIGKLAILSAVSLTVAAIPLYPGLAEYGMTVPRGYAVATLCAFVFAFCLTAFGDPKRTPGKTRMLATLPVLSGLLLASVMVPFASDPTTLAVGQWVFRIMGYFLGGITGFLLLRSDTNVLRGLARAAIACTTFGIAYGIVTLVT